MKNDPSSRASARTRRPAPAQRKRAGRRPVAAKRRKRKPPFRPFSQLHGWLNRYRTTPVRTMVVIVGLGSPIMSISMTDDMWGTFNVREDQLKGLKAGDTFSAYVPAFDKEIKMRVYSIEDEGSYAVWKATKTTGQYDLKTFEVKARPETKMEGLRAGMSLVLKR